MANLIGAKIERKEDKKFLTGKGRYTADINLASSNSCIFCAFSSCKGKNNKS